MSNILRWLLGKTGQETWIEPDSYVADKITGYFGRTTDRDQIRDAIIQRYGTGFRIDKDATSGITIKSYERSGFRERMMANQIEIVSLGLGHKIVNALSNLFSETTQNFSYVSKLNSIDISKIVEYLDKMRNGEQYLAGLTSADIMSIQCASSTIFTEFIDGRLRYRVLDPGKIRMMYHESIEVDGRIQPTDYRRIDDASKIIIKTGTISDGITDRYVGIVGRCDQYPIGRYVAYTGDADSRDLPAVGSGSAMDWRIDGEIANPLTYYGLMNPDLEVPEYPISIIYGGNAGNIGDDDILPLSDSLMRDSLECDIAASQIRGAAAKHSEGTRVLTKSKNGSSQLIPRSLHGNVILEDGQKLEDLKNDIASVQIAWETLRSQMVSIASSYMVPDYLISSEDHTVEASSGVALKVRTKPLLKLRENRVRQNKPSIYRLFEIEKALISIFADVDNDQIIEVLKTCEQKWDAGEMIAPENVVEKTNVLKTLYEIGVYDPIETIRIQYGLGSEAEAIDMYNKLKKRSQLYPSLLDTNNVDIVDD
ncbi:MAG: hypothetical protein PVI90_00660 [Desulfobacteraceae bacterium]